MIQVETEFNYVNLRYKLLMKSSRKVHNNILPSSNNPRKKLVPTLQTKKLLHLDSNMKIIYFPCFNVVLEITTYVWGRRWRDGWGFSQIDFTIEMENLDSLVYNNLTKSHRSRTEMRSTKPAIPEMWNVWKLMWKGLPSRIFIVMMLYEHCTSFIESEAHRKCH